MHCSVTPLPLRFAGSQRHGTKVILSNRPIGSVEEVRSGGRCHTVLFVVAYVIKEHRLRSRDGDLAASRRVQLPKMLSVLTGFS